MASIRLRVQWAPPTLAIFKQLQTELSWDETEEHSFKSKTESLTIADVANRIEELTEGIYERRARGTDTIQVQVRSITTSRVTDRDLPWGDHVNQHLKPGDTIIVTAMAMSESGIRQMQQEVFLKKFRASLRFDLNDRVVCFCGPRWLSGHIVGTAVPDPDDNGILPYLVKTDPLPGVPSRTISVPSDSDDICRQEVCFNPSSELHLIKAAAAVIPESGKPKTRFAVGDEVVCRIHNNTDDGLEQWVPGKVSMTWVTLPGEQKWEIGGISGTFPDVVPYKIDLISNSWIFCHRDVYTLIRKKGLEPQTRVRGISKRMEVRIAADGSKERIDHATERSKRLLDSELSSGESD